MTSGLNSSVLIVEDYINDSKSLVFVSAHNYGANEEIVMFKLTSSFAVAEFQFTQLQYSVSEDVGSAKVDVSLVNGTLDRSVVVTVTTHSFQATGLSILIIIMVTTLRKTIRQSDNTVPQCNMFKSFDPVNVWLCIKQWCMVVVCGILFAATEHC